MEPADATPRTHPFAKPRAARTKRPALEETRRAAEGAGGQESQIRFEVRGKAAVECDPLLFHPQFFWLFHPYIQADMCVNFGLIAHNALP